MDAKLSMSPPESGHSAAPWLLGGRMAQTSRRVARLHNHARGQIFGITHGVMALRTDRAYWTIGAGQFLWLPPDLPHEARSHGAISGWSLYIAPFRCTDLPSAPFLSQGTTLLNAQAERLSDIARPALWSAVTERLAESFWDEFCALPRETAALPFPQDPRLKRVAQALCDDPSDNRKLLQWATLAGMSQRSFIRHFGPDTGLSFSAWRQRLRMIQAMEQLARGDSVSDVAAAAGYESLGAFSAAFLRVTGTRPLTHKRPAGR
ncbi:AraC family transcriptional regulator [Asaia lannensis NBRC 102526]|nr:AraC family transcriptional regulator [Asaia lannensis NBRC 102526]